MRREFAVLTSQYPKQPLQHGRDEDEGGTPSHHTAAGIKSHNICFLFLETSIISSSFYLEKKNYLITSVRPLLTPEHGRGGSPDQRNSQVIFTKLLMQPSQNHTCNHDKIIIMFM